MPYKREQIIDFAVELFKRHGIISVTMDDLAGFAGVSKKTLYLFFHNKAEMVEAVLDILIAKFRRILAANKERSADPVQELLFQQELFAEWTALQNILNVFVLKKFPRAMRKYEEFKFVNLKEAICKNLEQGLRDGYYRPELEPLKTSDLYIAIIDRFLLNNSGNYKEALEVLSMFINALTTMKGRQYLSSHVDKQN